MRKPGKIVALDLAQALNADMRLTGDSFRWSDRASAERRRTALQAILALSSLFLQDTLLSLQDSCEK